MAFRISIRRLKQVIWLLCVLAAVWAGWTFFDIWSGKQDGRYDSRKSSYFSEVMLSRTERRGEAQQPRGYYEPERYTKLWDALVDGSVRVVDVPVDTTDKPEVVEQVQLPDLASIVTVGMVFYSNDPIDRFIAVTYAGAESGAAATGKQRRLHLSEGDPLRPPYDEAPYHGRVLRISLQEVTFSWGEDEVTLTPSLGTGGEGVPVSRFELTEADDPADDVEGVPTESVEVRPGHWVMGSADLGRLQADPGRFLAEELNARTISMPTGERTQLELTNVPEGSLAYKYGARSKDRVISVNGVPMASVSGAINWFKQNSELPTYVVVYERAGKQLTTTIHVK